MPRKSKVSKEMRKKRVQRSKRKYKLKKKIKRAEEDPTSDAFANPML